jgi:predicted transcriptional regulator
VKSLENEPLGETSQNNGIQVSKNRVKTCENLVKAHENGPKPPRSARYRKIHAYTKSLERYKLERERRRKVRALAKKGLKQKEIANELGVSIRTVKRDWKKQTPYLVGQFNRQVWEINAQQREKERQRYEGLTIKEELKLIRQDLKALKKRHLL